MVFDKFGVFPRIHSIPGIKLQDWETMDTPDYLGHPRPGPPRPGPRVLGEGPNMVGPTWENTRNTMNTKKDPKLVENHGFSLFLINLDGIFWGFSINSKIIF